jgi:pyrroline-5-carboxylate reductase
MAEKRTQTPKASKKAPTTAKSVGFIGAGNMAAALIKGFLEAGLYEAKQLWVSDVDAKRLSLVRKRYGVDAAPSNAKLVAKSKIIILAVKPQIVDQVLTELRALITPDHLFITIAAGISTLRIENTLGVRVRVLRVMPNTPSMVGKGMSVLVRGRFATAADEKLGVKLLSAVGAAVAIPHERMLDAVTGLSGSGPAYVYLFAEGLIAGGIQAGLPGPLAVQLAFQTIAGAAAMLLETGDTPESLRAQVSSPGGTTLAGLSELNRRGFKDSIASAIIAATRRAQELGRA